MLLEFLTLFASFLVFTVIVTVVVVIPMFKWIDFVADRWGIGNKGMIMALGPILIYIMALLALVYTLAGGRG